MIGLEHKVLEAEVELTGLHCPEDSICLLLDRCPTACLITEFLGREQDDEIYGLALRRLAVDLVEDHAYAILGGIRAKHKLLVVVRIVQCYAPRELSLKILEVAHALLSPDLVVPDKAILGHFMQRRCQSRKVGNE